MYEEIKELYAYCKKKGIPAMKEEFYDGYAIRFPCGGDFVQHKYSYGSHRGCVEPAIGSKVDYTAVKLKNAKRLIDRYYGKKAKDDAEIH